MSSVCLWALGGLRAYVQQLDALMMEHMGVEDIGVDAASGVR